MLGLTVAARWCKSGCFKHLIEHFVGNGIRLVASYASPLSYDLHEIHTLTYQLNAYQKINAVTTILEMQISIGETVAALILTLWLAPSKHFVGWIELDPKSTASRKARLKDSWIKGNMREDKQNQKRVKELANKVYSKALERKNR
jgi:hypothetical protein